MRKLTRNRLCPSLPQITAIAFLAALLLASGCKNRAKKSSVEIDGQSEETNSSEKVGGGKTRGREVFAVWYPVPPDSLAKRRAAPDELTAAHNHLPLGTLMRVTHVANGKSVIVRITDRGITNRRARLDLCKEAAEQLGMVREGIARVRMELLPDDKKTAAALDSGSRALDPR